MNTLLCVFAALLTIKATSCNGQVRGTNRAEIILEAITNTREFVTKNIKILENVEKDLFHKINGIDIENDVNKINGVSELFTELRDVYHDAWVKRDSTKTSFLLNFCYPMYDYALFQINGKLQTEISRYVLYYKRMWLAIFDRLTLPFLEKMEKKYIKETRKKLLECESGVKNEFCEIYAADKKELNLWIKDIEKTNYDLGTLIDASKEELFKQDLSELIEMILLDPLYKCMYKSEIDCVLDPYSTLSWKLDRCLLKI